MLQRFCKEHVYTMYTIALNIIVLIVFLNELKKEVINFYHLFRKLLHATIKAVEIHS